MTVYLKIVVYAFLMTAFVPLYGQAKSSNGDVLEKVGNSAGEGIEQEEDEEVDDQEKEDENGNEENDQELNSKGEESEENDSDEEEKENKDEVEEPDNEKSSKAR